MNHCQVKNPKKTYKWKGKRRHCYIQGKKITHDQLDAKKVSDVVAKTSRKFKHVTVSEIHRHINEKGR